MVEPLYPVGLKALLASGKDERPAPQPALFHLDKDHLSVMHCAEGPVPGRGCAR